MTVTKFYVTDVVSGFSLTVIPVDCDIWSFDRQKTTYSNGITYTEFNRAGGENNLTYNGPNVVNATITNPTPTPTGLCTKVWVDFAHTFGPQHYVSAATRYDPNAYMLFEADSTVQTLRWMNKELVEWSTHFSKAYSNRR